MESVRETNNQNSEEEEDDKKDQDFKLTSGEVSKVFTIIRRGLQNSKNIPDNIFAIIN